MTTQEEKYLVKQHSDYVTHIDNEDDLVYLRTVAFPVNMRLFKTSPEYKAIILKMCDYIREMCLNGAEGYKKPHGMSSANLALGLNIIGVTRNRGQEDEYCQIMINPEIVEVSDETIITQSNCGSLTLSEPINVKRFEEVKIAWYDEEGRYYRKIFDRSEGGFSFQHEIDHNNGILIVDREAE